jgi:phosphohistidine phosphatase
LWKKVLILHILRHAKTSQESSTGLDIDRQLLEKGEKQAALLAEYLVGLSQIDIHCSTSARTRKTFDIISQKVQYDSIHFSQDLYLCSHLELLFYINQVKSTKDLLLIGHNNGLSDFVSYLTGEFIDLKTCQYCCLEIKLDSWQELSGGAAKLISTFRPDVD